MDQRVVLVLELSWKSAARQHHHVLFLLHDDMVGIVPFNFRFVEVRSVFSLLVEAWFFFYVPFIISLLACFVFFTPGIASVWGE